MNLNAQKRMAAEILKCGENRIYFDPYLTDEIKMAITREDIRNLIKEGIIQKKYKQGISKSRKNLLHERHAVGAGSGPARTRAGLKPAPAVSFNRYISVTAALVGFYLRYHQLLSRVPVCCQPLPFFPNIPLF